MKVADQQPEQPTAEPEQNPTENIQDEVTKLPTEENKTSCLPRLSAEPTFFEKNYKRIRINEKEEYTYTLILELDAKEPNREYLSSDIIPLSGRSQSIEARYLKTLWEQGKLTREWRNRQYYYRLSTPTSKTVSQNTVSNSQTLTTQNKDSRTTAESLRKAQNNNNTQKQ